jgi:hypothetical protein
MKALCLLLLGLDIAILVAAYMPYEYWAFNVCRKTLGLCDYPVVLGLGAAAWIGMFIAVKEME